MITRNDYAPNAAALERIRKAHAVLAPLADLEAELPEAVQTAITTRDNVADIKRVESDPVPAAIEAHALAILESAKEGKSVSTTALDKAVARKAALEAQDKALGKAGTMAANNLVAAVVQSEAGIIGAIQGKHSAAVETLEAVAEEIPASIQDVAAATYGGHAEAWLRAKDAVATIITCERVKSGLVALGAKADIDHDGDLAVTHDLTDWSKYRNHDDEVAQRLAMVRDAVSFWLPTAAEQIARYNELLEQKRRRLAATQVDPAKDAVAKQTGEDWRGQNRQAGLAAVQREQDEGTLEAVVRERKEAKHPAAALGQ